MPRRTGPKSRTQRQKSSPRKSLRHATADLGDESVTSTDEQSDAAASFQTPPCDENVTDYNLELTTSRALQTPLTREKQVRRVTLRSVVRDQAPSTSRAAAELSTPQTASASRNVRLQDQSEALSEAATRNITLAARQISASKSRADKGKGTGATTSRSRRKQQTPQLHRFLREYKRLAECTDFLMPRLPFSRVVREILMTISELVRITPEALGALQTASEMYLTKTLEDSYLLTIHAKRVTLMVKDMALINFLRCNWNY